MSTDDRWSQPSAPYGEARTGLPAGQGHPDTYDHQGRRGDPWVGQRRRGSRAGPPRPAQPPPHPQPPHPYPPRRRAQPEPEVGVLTGGSRPIRSHGRRRRRIPIWMILVLVLGVGALAYGLRQQSGPAASFQAGPDATALDNSPLAPAPLPFRSADVTAAGVNTEGFLSWALLDRRSGEIVGSDNMDATSTTASMIKAWLAADYLRRAAEQGEEPSDSRLQDLERMIRDSDNDAADRTFSADGGSASIERLISTCGLTDSQAVPGSWSSTKISAEDTVRMGGCIADGRAAGEKWTPWVLDMMRRVRDVGDFGIREAFPPEQQARIAIKNGWLLRDEDQHWHTSCMAIGDTWVLGVLQRYPTHGDWNSDFAHTAQVCQDVATQLLNPDAG